ncbi:hypothetical protein AEM51_00340 [Bacteroidetes bacterium UKL13-3]|jgi:hypothetical protein|nr:hypothetical protein AEM51_00340 [Bacteroidetes bacterium UKL13-3]
MFGIIFGCLVGVFLVGLGTTNPVGRLEVFDDVITQVELGSVGPFTLGSRWNSIGDRVNNPPTGASVSS